MTANRWHRYPSFWRQTTNVLLCAILVLVVGGCSSKPHPEKPLDDLLSSGQLGLSAPPEAGRSFDELFYFSHAIRLDSSAIIGSISRVSIGTDGSFIVIDRRPKQAWLFDASGAFLRILNPEPCHPGLPWAPNDAIDLHDGRWLVSNSSTGAFLFDRDGSCLRSILEQPEQGYVHWAEGSGGTVLGIKFSGRTVSVDRFSAGGAAPTLFAEFLVSSATQLTKTLGGLIGTGEHVIVALPASPVVAAFGDSNSGRSQPTGLGFAPRYFKISTTDTELEAETSTAERIKRLYESRSMIFDAFLIDSNTLATLHYNGFNQASSPDETFGLQVIDWRTGSVLNNPILFSGREAPVAASGGFLYRLASPTDEEVMAGAFTELHAYRMRGQN